MNYVTNTYTSYIINGTTNTTTTSSSNHYYINKDIYWNATHAWDCKGFVNFGFRQEKAEKPISEDEILDLIKDD